MVSGGSHDSTHPNKAPPSRGTLLCVHGVRRLRFQQAKSSALATASRADDRRAFQRPFPSGLPIGEARSNGLSGNWGGAAYQG